MQHTRSAGFLIVLLGLAASPAAAQLGSDRVVDVRLVPDKQRVLPGSELVVAVVFEMGDGWHINPHDAEPPASLPSLRPIPTTIEVVDDDGQPLQPRAGALTPYRDYLQWPEAHEIEWDLIGGKYRVYEDGAVAYLPVTVAADAQGGTAALTVNVGYQACDDSTCLRQSVETLTLEVEVVPPARAAAAAATRPAYAALFAGFDVGVWPDIRAGVRRLDAVAFDVFGLEFELDPNGPGGLSLLLLVAAIGGLLLNLTPCVLPVIPLKIMGLAQTAGNRGRTLVLGLAMSAGVVAFWLGLGGAIASIKTFDAINKLFQHPEFTIGVGVVIAVMAVGMCGLFAVRLPRFVYKINPEHGSLHGSFGFGIMTAVLSTPCTAPLMGAAAAWATKQPASTTMLTFAAIGGGMALPYLVLSAFPKLVERMPRSGPASELIKQVMGLLMLAAAAYFVGVGLSAVLQTPPDPPSRAYWWAVAACVAAAGGWLVWRAWAIASSAWARGVWTLVGGVFVAVAVAGGMKFSSHGPIDWVYYTPDRFEQTLDGGSPVLMDFTAEWCLNCKALEEAVLHDPRVTAALREKGVVPIKVDITGNNPEGSAMLKRVDRVAIPLLVVFDADGNEVFKSDAYTVDQVLAAIDAAAR